MLKILQLNIKLIFSIDKISDITGINEVKQVNVLHILCKSTPWYTIIGYKLCETFAKMSVNNSPECCALLIVQA